MCVNLSLGPASLTDDFLRFTRTTKEYTQFFLASSFLVHPPSFSDAADADISV